MRKHRVMLDIDVHPREEVEMEAKRLDEEFSLGGYVIEPSFTESCWRVIYPKAMLEWEDALKVAESCRLVDREWLDFCRRYKCFGASTEMSRTFQPYIKKPKNTPVKELTGVILMVKPKTELDLKRMVKLCEQTDDKAWLWRVVYPLTCVYEGVAGVVEIGCKDKYQAERRINFIKKLEINCEFEVKE